LRRRKCWGKLKDAATRFVLRPVKDASNAFAAGALGEITLIAFPRPPSWLWRREIKRGE